MRPESFDAYDLAHTLRVTNAKAYEIIRALVDAGIARVVAEKKHHSTRRYSIVRATAIASNGDA